MSPVIVGTFSDKTISGSVARPTAIVNTETLSFEDYGAVGDGITDDTIAVKLALADSSSSGKLIISSGEKVYLITAKLLVSGSAKLDMRGSVFKQADNANLDRIVTVSISTNRTNIRIAVDGNRDNNTGEITAIYLTKLARAKNVFFEVSNCDIGVIAQGNVESSEIRVHGVDCSLVCKVSPDSSNNTPDENHFIIHAHTVDNVLFVDSRETDGTQIQITGEYNITAEHVNETAIDIRGRAVAKLGGFLRGQCYNDNAKCVFIGNGLTQADRPKIQFNGLYLLGNGDSANTIGVDIYTAYHVFGSLVLENFTGVQLNIHHIESWANIGIDIRDSNAVGVRIGEIGHPFGRAQRVKLTGTVQGGTAVDFAYSRDCHVEASPYLLGAVNFESTSLKDVIVVSAEDRDQTFSKSGSAKPTIRFRGQISESDLADIAPIDGMVIEDYFGTGNKHLGARTYDSVAASWVSP